MRGIEVDQKSVWILGLGVREVGRSRRRVEEHVEEGDHRCRQDHRRNADDICGGKDRRTLMFVLLFMSLRTF